MKKNEFIQYVGSSEQIDKEIRKITSDDSILIDLTGDKELEKFKKIADKIEELDEETSRLNDDELKEIQALNKNEIKCLLSFQLLILKKGIK